MLLFVASFAIGALIITNPSLRNGVVRGVLFAVTLLAGSYAYTLSIHEAHRLHYSENNVGMIAFVLAAIAMFQRASSKRTKVLQVIAVGVGFLFLINAMREIIGPALTDNTIRDTWLVAVACYAFGLFVAPHIPLPRWIRMVRFLDRRYEEMESTQLGGGKR